MQQNQPSRILSSKNDQAIESFLEGLLSRNSIQDIKQYVHQTKNQKVLVIGESIIDEYQYCSAIGKSSKEPMLVMKKLSTEKFAGGILAVANHVANFCNSPGLLTYLGLQNTQEDFILENLDDSIVRHFLYRSDAPTIVKRRIVESYFFTKVLALYEYNEANLIPSENQALCDMLEQQLPEYDIVIVVDFGHGFLGKEAVDILCSKSKFLAVNTQSNAGNWGFNTVSKYPRADYISLAVQEVRMEARDKEGHIEDVVARVAERLDCPRIAATLGKEGCLLYEKGKGSTHVPALAREVVDRMGAGDSFISVTTPLVAQGAPSDIVGFIGNIAGSLAVATVGNRTPINQESLFQYMDTLFQEQNKTK